MLPPHPTLPELAAAEQGRPGDFGRSSEVLKTFIFKKSFEALKTLVAIFSSAKGTQPNTFDCDRTRSNGFNLREGRFRLDGRKKFFMIRGRNTATDSPERQWRPHPCKHSKPGWAGL